MKSVLQDWVMELPLRQQGVLVLALRGPDGVRKEDAAKPIVRTLRALMMNSGREGTAMGRAVRWHDDPFMSTVYINSDIAWSATAEAFFDQWDAYNVHFLQHLVHAFAIVGMHHPFEDYRARCWKLYEFAVNKLHMYPETPEQITFRLRDGIRKEAGEGNG
jgi:hypothetical protein